MLEYMRTCCFSKNMTLNAIEAFQKGQEYHGPVIWQKYEEFGTEFLILHQKNYKYDQNIFEAKIETETRLWKVGKQGFGSL